jgi:hypothetical protein
MLLTTAFYNVTVKLIYTVKLQYSSLHEIPFYCSLLLLSRKFYPYHYLPVLKLKKNMFKTYFFYSIKLIWFQTRKRIPLYSSKNINIFLVSFLQPVSALFAFTFFEITHSLPPLIKPRL